MQKKSGHMLSVRLNDSLWEKLALASEKEKLKKAAVVKRALEIYLARPKEETQTSLEVGRKVKALEEKYSEVLSKVDILSRQVDHLLGTTKDARRYSGK